MFHAATFSPCPKFQVAIWLTQGRGAVQRKSSLSLFLHQATYIYDALRRLSQVIDGQGNVALSLELANQILA